MMQLLEPILKHLSVLVEKLPPNTVDHLAQTLEESQAERLKGRLATLSATSESKALFQELDRLWAKVPDLDCKSMSLALKSARWVFTHSTDIQQVNIVWTGPATEAVPVRRTEQVLREIIDEAKSELLIVSFVAYKVEEIMAALHKALVRGVRLRMILETEEESGGKVTFDQIRAIQKLLPEAQIFTWPLKNRYVDSNGNHGSIHAKCAVADRQLALVSSANLTGFALELNMELGIVIKGGSVIISIADHFDELIRRNILTKIR